MSDEITPPPLAALVRYFLHLGAFGFGGPIALAGYMQRDLVEDRRWISRQEYVDGLALAQLAPGPLAAQLAMYLGWARAGVLGATLVSAAFILPSLVMVMALSALYVHFGEITWMQQAFYGIGAAVIAVIARSAVKLMKLTLTRDRLLWSVCLINGLVTGWTESEVVWLFALSGIVTMLVRAPPQFLRRAAPMSIAPWAVFFLTGLSGRAPVSTVWKLCVYFAMAGTFVFGSGLAIVPFLHGGVVVQYHWLTERQFLDAVAVAMITPGPVVITVSFVGYLVAGTMGGLAAALGVFLPCYLFVIVLAPFYRRFGANPQVKAFVSGVTAAATGAIAGAAFVLGRRAIVDVPTALICLATGVLLFRVKRAPEPLVILGAGVLGIVARAVLAR